MNQNLAYSYNNIVKPLAEKELQFLYKKTSLINDRDFSDLARWSIKTKAFHSLGASIFCVPQKAYGIKQFVSGIVAFETIADFLDTICDRSHIKNESDYASLHNIMVKTLILEHPNEYKIIPETSEYFRVLIDRSQKLISQLPGYLTAKPYLIETVNNYLKMQTNTHLAKGLREKKCQDWFSVKKELFKPEIFWWEFTASGGSTLTIFSLLLAASNKNLDDNQASLVFDAYYPWMNGINILMDSFIDQNDDAKSGDMNFMKYYKNNAKIEAGLSKLIITAWEKSASLDMPDFHHFVISEMVKLYSYKALQDNKLRVVANNLLNLLSRLSKKD